MERLTNAVKFLLREHISSTVDPSSHRLAQAHVAAVESLEAEHGDRSAVIAATARINALDSKAILSNSKEEPAKEPAILNAVSTKWIPTPAAPGK